MFNYDPQAPLDFQEHDRQTWNSIELQEMSYASPCGGRVPAFLLIPQHKGSLAGLLFMHPADLGKDAFLKEAAIFCQGGAVALLIDAPYARPPCRPTLNFTDRDYDDFIQAVVDLRRGVDLLSARPDVDASRIGYVGFSYGATIGAMLAGIEKRIKTYIIWGGAAHLTSLLRDHRKNIRQENLEAYLEKMAALDSIHHIGRAAPSTLFFQNGRREKRVPAAEVEALHEATSAPKRVAWYDTGHALNGTACRDRFEWLREQLHLDPLPSALVKELGKFQLKQMTRKK